MRIADSVLASVSVLAATLLLSAPATVRAQSLETVAPDTRIRVELPTVERSPFGRERTQSVVGTLRSVRDDTLLLVVRPGAEPLRLPLTAMRAVYTSRGRPSRWQGAMRGAVMPALIGAALSAVATSIHHRDEDPGPAQAAASSAAWGALWGAVLGAWSPKERWRRLSPPDRGAMIAETGHD